MSRVAPRRRFLRTLAGAAVALSTIGAIRAGLDHEAIFRRIIEAAGSPRLPLGPAAKGEPCIILAYRAGFTMAVGNERTTAETLVYPWLCSREARNMVHARELARAFMLREGIEHTEDDVDRVRSLLLERA